MSFTFDWVLLNKLALGPCPLKEKHLKLIKKNNIKSVLSLCSYQEAVPPDLMQELFICKRIILPDHKYEANLSIEQVNDVLELLENLFEQGPVFVHCVASIERSPLICMAWLVKNCNLSPFEAHDYLKEIHPISNPLPNQFSLLSEI